jgi:hypothetical protein
MYSNSENIEKRRINIHGLILVINFCPIKIKLMASARNVCSTPNKNYCENPFTWRWEVPVIIVLQQQNL